LSMSTLGGDAHILVWHCRGPRSRKGDPARRSTDIPRYISINLMSMMLIETDAARCN
jgi:hypothetical protein